MLNCTTLTTPLPLGIDSWNITTRGPAEVARGNASRTCMALMSGRARVEVHQGKLPHLPVAVAVLGEGVLDYEHGGDRHW